MEKTLIILTFDEVETYTDQNKIYAVLLGGAIDASLHGTTDNTFYNHYSSKYFLNFFIPVFETLSIFLSYVLLTYPKQGFPVNFLLILA